ncbi:uncharacterized protein LOC129586063 [Paramacrobiotus metropolitanus]|uniref:uncharacterized protein LOC129586063 n=1 Tax=Paramacrobiotus metropolitanus TaxID=2943436 RepID=UPI002445A815|nr:uncharacterized protein LOC129586063 [Paramacrobiotus metropolitanus]XP_055335033.1 uncharacterized protein LOC129586063 [Paramacrobiotus metropolitanus]XP_055335034.1 uncharacterized protein LOC129586063 [Paramacrobiotus metropolitanus]
MFCCWQTPEPPLDRERQYPWDHHYSPYCKDHAKLSHNLNTKYLSRNSGFARNAVVSPLYAEIALLMLHAGVDDKAKQEIAELLGVHPVTLTKRLRLDLSHLKWKEDEDCDPGPPEGKDENYRLYLASSLLLSQCSPSDQQCTKAFNKITISSDISPLKLSDNLRKVNEFFRERAMSHVCDIQLPPDSTRNPTLISNLHLRANWARPYFREHRTLTMEFITADGRRL